MEPGTIGWIDLTIPDARQVRDFYAGVAGWTAQPVNMGDYDDWAMAANGKPVAGICHARGVNQGLPAAWLMYIVVPNLDEALERCLQMGGTIVRGIKAMGPNGRYAIIQDPAGAVCALYQAA